MFSEKLLCSYIYRLVLCKELQLCIYMKICFHQGTAAVYIHADLCLGCTQLECALEIPKCACRNAPLPIIGLNSIIIEIINYIIIVVDFG